MAEFVDDEISKKFKDVAMKRRVVIEQGKVLNFTFSMLFIEERKILRSSLNSKPNSATEQTMIAVE